MVVSRDLCPIQCWTVRTSKPRRSMLVAYVDRKVFRSNSSGSRPARSATSLQRLRKFCSRLPVGEETRTGCQSLPACEQLRQFDRNRHFAFFPALREEFQIALGEDAHCSQLRIEILPEQVHHFLFPESRKQERRK